MRQSASHLPLGLRVLAAMSAPTPEAARVELATALGLPPTTSAQVIYAALVMQTPPEELEGMAQCIAYCLGADVDR